MIAMLVSTVLSAHFLVNETASVSSGATISIDPRQVSIYAGLSFDINVRVTNVTDLDQFTLYVRFNTTLLAVLEVRNGAQNASNLDFTPFNRTSWNATGLIGVDGRFRSPVNDETLASITFVCMQEGVCDVTVTEATKLFHPHSVEIERTMVNARCTCTQSVVVRDPIRRDKNYTLPCDLFLEAPSQYVFIINGSDVVLDLNGHAITNHRYQISGVGTGIQASGVHNIWIKNGEISTFQTGIDIRNCTDVRITNVTLYNSFNIGIYVHEGSANFTIADSTINNTQYGEGIYLKECCQKNSSWANITGNLMSGNVNGICLESSNNCNISENTMTSNNVGLYLKTNVQNTKVFNNNFMLNRDETGAKCNVKATDSQSVWNISYPYGGNYWDDYVDQMIKDSCSGATGEIPLCDGIGDTAYNITGDTQDKCPLLSEFNTSRLRVFDIPLEVSRPGLTETMSVVIAVYGDFADAGNVSFSDTEKGGLITFDISNGTYCNVIVSRELLDGLRVSVNNVTEASTLYQDAKYTFAELSHVVGSQVEIATKMTGDINGDGKVNIIDITIVAKQWLQTIHP
jgi:parallel beta-helix repeat protein